MAIMKKDVNLGLLLVIIAALIMFSGFTVYYQTTFKNLSATYQKQVKELQKITTDLEAKRGLLNETSVQLQLKKQKEEDLSKKFVDTASERDKLNADKNKLTSDLTNTKATLAQTSADLAITKVTLAQTQSDLDKEKTARANDIATLNSRINSLNAKIDCLKTKADADEGTC